jgi:hypothetical protein
VSLIKAVSFVLKLITKKPQMNIKFKIAFCNNNYIP